jgi:hypothetical protein
MGASYIHSNKNEGCFINISVEKMDELYIDKKNLCFIKIDVEGFESKVLKGAKKTISAHYPIIVLEQHKIDFSENETESILLLKEMGYKFCWHQKGFYSKNKFFRIISYIKELFFGGTHTMVTDERVPTENHSMLIAVPPRFQKKLNF